MTNSLTQTNNDVLISNVVGIDIEGLEDVSAGIVPVPWLKLVQPTSRNIETVSGQEAAVGSFYYSDTKEALEVVRFSMLKAKQGVVEFERDGELRRTTRIAILGYDLENERKFVLTLSVTSFSSFGSLVARLKQAKITNTLSHAITISSEKMENDKGKFHVVKFELGEALPEEKVKELVEIKEAYGFVLNRQASEDIKAAVAVFEQQVEEPKEVAEVNPDLQAPTEDVAANDLPF